LTSAYTITSKFRANMNGNKEVDGTEEFLIKWGISQSKKKSIGNQ